MNKHIMLFTSDPYKIIVNNQVRQCKYHEPVKKKRITAACKLKLASRQCCTTAEAPSLPCARQS